MSFRNSAVSESRLRIQQRVSEVTSGIVEGSSVTLAEAVL
jgi:hypothetical protein